MSASLLLRRGSAATGVHRSSPLLRRRRRVTRPGEGAMPATKKKKSGGNGAALMEAPEGLALGSSGDDVKPLQDYLVRFGYLGPPPSAEDGRRAELDLRPVTEPGEFDEATQEALRTFQKMAGLEVTGELDAPTRE